MASTENKQSLSDMVFDIKQKLSDEEYKNIMDKIGEINKKKYIKISYTIFTASIKYETTSDDDEDDDEDDEPTPKISSENFTTICEVLDSSADKPLFLESHNIHEQCVIRSQEYTLWKKTKAKNDFWETYPFGDDERYMVVRKFEEL